MDDIFWTSKKDKRDKEFRDSDGGYGPGGANGGNSNNIVDVSNNRIFFYSTVDRGRVLKLNKALLSLSVSMTHRAMHLDSEVVPIKLHINSYGGSVFQVSQQLIIFYSQRFQFIQSSTVVPHLQQP